MTDARLPSHWLTDPDLDMLTDRAWRTYTNALMWSAGAGTDGRLTPNSLRFLHSQGVDADTASELVQAHCWTASEDGGYQVLNWDRSQSLHADVEHQRERNRRNVAAMRARGREARTTEDGDSLAYVSGDVSDDIPEDVSDNPGGKARTGKAQLDEPELSVTSAGDSQFEDEPPPVPPRRGDLESTARIIAIARRTGCTECQRRSAFPNAQPCAEHEEKTA